MKKVVAFENQNSVSEVDKSPRWVQITKYNSAGEILSEVTLEDRKQNGSGFVLSYTDKMIEFIGKYSTGATVRLFLYLAHNQQYGTNGVFGFRCSRVSLQNALGLTRKTVYSALMELKNDFLVHELRVDGVSEFMVNPNYVTIGKEKKTRLAEWNKRWAESFRQSPGQSYTR